MLHFDVGNSAHLISPNYGGICFVNLEWGFWDEFHKEARVEALSVLSRKARLLIHKHLMLILLKAGLLYVCIFIFSLDFIVFLPRPLELR